MDERRLPPVLVACWVEGHKAPTPANNWKGNEVMTGPPIPVESIGRVDLLLGQAAMLTADRWDEVPSTVDDAMAIVLLMAAAHPWSRPVDIPGLSHMSALDCVGQALREVQSWDLALAAELPDLARLRVLLSDARTNLNATPAIRS